jgi:hypothetical protein
VRRRLLYQTTEKTGGYLEKSCHALSRELFARPSRGLWFDTKEEAVSDAERERMADRVEEPDEVKRRTLSLSENVKLNHVGPWTR